jgi:hypothetical protein
MKRRLLRLSLLSLFCYAAGAYAENVTDYFGRWHVAEIADYANVSAVSDAVAKRKIGSDFVMSAQSVKFDHRTCKPNYELSTVDPEKDLQEGYRITNQTLKLPRPVVMIDTGCLHNRFVYVVSPDQVILEQSGVFYRASRVSNTQSRNPARK